jgi:RimJ/RimL family protein N-acetyltransferase
MTDPAKAAPEIVTPRLALRRVSPADCSPITEAVNDPRIYRMVARIPPGQTKAQTLAWIATHDRGRQADTDHVFAIVWQGAFSGVIGAHRSAADDPFEIGYWLKPDSWGQGLCTEAGRGLLGWLETRRKVRVLVSGHFADNPASGRVLRKLRFLPCGRNRMYSAGRGEAADHILMARIS